MRDAEIFDMDGTLCDVRTIRHLVKGDVRNFHQFHLQSASCPPNPDVVSQARLAHSEGRAVLIVTARSTLFRNVTAMWLALHNVPSDAMYMRRNGDWRKDFQVKKDTLCCIRKRWNPVHAYDDNPAVIGLWESEGIPTTVVPGWE
jgi:hypothetical protein